MPYSLYCYGSLCLNKKGHNIGLGHAMEDDKAYGDSVGMYVTEWFWNLSRLLCITFYIIYINRIT
jgi:hypothetical protein